jgi:hypothetical protein
MEPLDIMKALNIVSQLVESDEVGCVQKFSLQAFEKRLHHSIKGALT